MGAIAEGLIGALAASAPVIAVTGLNGSGDGGFLGNDWDWFGHGGTPEIRTLKTIISDRGEGVMSAHFGPRYGLDEFKLGGVLCLSTGVEDYCQDLLRQSTEARS